MGNLGNSHTIYKHCDNETSFRTIKVTPFPFSRVIVVSYIYLLGFIHIFVFLDYFRQTLLPSRDIVVQCTTTSFYLKRKTILIIHTYF